MASQAQFKPTPIAVVSRAPLFKEHNDQYLRLDDDGQPVRVDKADVATTFPSMREAARMAFRLPAALKAYGLLRDAEITIQRALH